MTYRLIYKDAKNQPRSGAYNDLAWKEQIARECYCKCVYCSIHEAQWGGIDHYHIDHFRPKSIARFAALINDICNLFYACPVCNRFKSNDWPADPDLDVPSYPDPSVTDYSTIFTLDRSSYTIAGKNISAKYLILQLCLNRPQLIYERRESALRAKEQALSTKLLNWWRRSTTGSLLQKHSRGLRPSKNTWHFVRTCVLINFPKSKNLKRTILGMIRSAPYFFLT